jgi:hypothetical protein
VDTGSMTERFEVGDLTFVTVKVVLFENGHCFWVLSDNVANYHFLGNHLAPRD